MRHIVASHILLPSGLVADLLVAPWGLRATLIPAAGLIMGAEMPLQSMGLGQVAIIWTEMAAAAMGVPTARLHL